MEAGKIEQDTKLMDVLADEFENKGQNKTHDQHGY